MFLFPLEQPLELFGTTLAEWPRQRAPNHDGIPWTALQSLSELVLRQQLLQAPKWQRA